MSLAPKNKGLGWGLGGVEQKSQVQKPWDRLKEAGLESRGQETVGRVEIRRWTSISP